MSLRYLVAGAWFAAALLAALPEKLAAVPEKLAAKTPATGTLESLHAAHEARPRDTSVTLELGLELERAGDLASAEQTLLEAARWDRQYQPAWTLANFYFRQDNRQAFWHWSSRAVAMAYDDYRPLLRLARAIEDDPTAIVLRLGNRPKLLRTLLDMMIGEHRMDAAQQVARRLADFHDPSDQPRFEALEKRMKEAQ